MLCVADFGTWVSGKFTFIGPSTVAGWESIGDKIHSLYGLEGSAQSSYIRHTPNHNNQTEYFTPIGTFISNLTRRLAWEDSALKDLVDYYQVTEIGGTGAGGFRRWPISIYSEDVQRCLQGKTSRLSSNTSTLDEWQVAFNLH